MAVKIYRKLLVDKSPMGGTQTNSYIVVHNSAGGRAKGVYDWFNKCLHGQGRDGVATHYTIDDKEGYQMLEDNWGAYHCGSGGAHYAAWGSGVKGASNANCIGIEVADDNGNGGVDLNVAIENCIELVRHLMQAYGIPISNVIRHGDVQNKGCPYYIMKMDKWQYMLNEIEKRNAAAQPIALDVSELKTADMTVNAGNSNTDSSSGGGNVTITFNDTTTVQESLPNANVSDNWVDMHKIKGITLHQYPPYHNCSADSMAKYFKALGWNRNFHYKVDKDTKIDFSKKPVSGQTTGGNIVGSSTSDFEVKPKDPLYSGADLGGGGGSDDDSGANPGTPIAGNDVATKIYNYCVSQGCSSAAACGIIGNAQQESSLKPDCVNSIGASGLWQWLAGRCTDLKAAASRAGVDWKDADFQIQYMWSEWSSSAYTNQLKKQKNITLDQWKKLTDPKKAAALFAGIFEAAHDKFDNTGIRGKYAQQWYDKFSSASTSAVDEPQVLMVSADEELKEPFGWPAPSQYNIQSYYGYRSDTLGYRYHAGMDIAQRAGYGAYCYADGTVKTVLTDTKLNGYVRVDHGNGVETVYASLYNIFVEEGEEIVGGQCIGLTDVTDANPLMHLHFEMIIDGEQVDPLIYIEPGGGNAKIPSGLGGIETFDITDANDNVTWDNIDKGKICFASADNNTHTYIDANLFNSQHPKYTLSVGAFFYDEYDLVEKTGKVDYPKTEKKIIQQTAKALYDEGFTSKELWREFDLNRAPSPFLYLDKDKWIAFCDEVDKQVDWLNKKYGKVTATYIPNNLLTDQNKNQFIETAPDGGNQGGSNQNTTQITSMANGLFIGDSWGEGIKDLVEADGATNEAKKGKDVLYYYNPATKTDRLKGMNQSPAFVYIYLGYNNLTTNVKNKCKDTKAFIDRVKELWPSVPIFQGALVHCAKKYKSSASFCENIDKYNEYMSSYFSGKDKMFWIDVSSGLVGSDGYMNSSMASSDGLHLKTYDVYYNNIKNAIMATSIVSGGSSDSPGGTTPDIGNNDSTKHESDTSNTDIQAQPGNVGKYAWVAVYNTCKLYKGADTATTKLATLPYGQEVHLLAADGIFYKVSASGKTGYVRAKNIRIVLGNNKYGYTYKDNIGKSAVLLPGTALYYLPTISSTVYKSFDTQQTCTILTAEVNFYEVKVGQHIGYAKAYRTRLSSDPTASSYDPELRIFTPDDDGSSDNETVDTTADPNNKKKYCYVGNTNGTALYKSSKLTASVVAELTHGDELYITGISSIFYKCTFEGKTGYVRAADVSIIGDAHGSPNSSYIGKNCWIKFADVDMYETKELTSPIATLTQQEQCVVKDIYIKQGAYKITTNQGTGWVKAYTVVFDPNEFKIEIDQTTNVLTNPNPSDDDVETTTYIALKDGEFETSEALSNWTKEGTLDFTWQRNPEWATPGHWPYRGEGFARIKNINAKQAGIKQDFSVNDKGKNFYLRILFYVKQVTQEDTSDGPSNPDSLKENGIYVKLLDKNKKVKHEKKISLSGITTTSWSRVGCVMGNLTLKDYTLYIGNNKTYDLYIDDIIIEQVDVNTANNVTGESDTSSGLQYSGLGTTSIDNGGVMVYDVAAPSNSGASQPTIKTVITQEEYEEIMKYAQPAYIDTYTNSFEPYDKDLDIAKTIGVKDDVRLETLTEELKTLTDNMIRYKVVETGPGSIDHCVKPVDELNVLYKNVECKVDPIYPDLIIPPQYTTSDYDTLSKNSIPLSTVDDATVSLEDSLDKSYSYDYDLLAEMKKKSTGKPVNYYDPYCYDDKITDLENHYPKVLIDEIESRMYSCNHPGCPIAHPMAKNFAMLSDMSIRQSKATEQRLVRLENSLATMVRYLGRMGSRMNINCVYYGGQTVLGKYKCIRCLHDNRVHDGATVTIDQCLSCTRYEPIIGQVYDILDETGFNGATILDDMQMSYMTLNDMKNLNKVNQRSTTYKYADTNAEMKNKPKNLIEEWRKQDKTAYEKELKKSISNKKKLQEALDAMQPSDYLFLMDWTEEEVDLQQPDVKAYPTEKIAAKYFNQAGDPAEVDVAPADESTQMGTEKAVYESLAKGKWVDTREVDDSVQKNAYTSLDFYFENFNLNRTGYEYDNGLKGNIGVNYTPGAGGDVDKSVNGTGSEIRQKIVEWAYKVADECKEAKATYCGDPRTVDPNNIKYYNGTRNGCTNPACYDCTSLVSTAYKYAGLTSMYAKSASGGSMVGEVVKNPGKIWLADSKGFAEALPGDVMMVANSKINPSTFNPKKPPSTHHAMIYTATNEVTHASGNYGPGKAIRRQKVTPDDSTYGGYIFFIRPKDLMDADAKSNNGSSGSANIIMTPGTIDGHNYVAKLNNARCTEYGTWDGASGTKVASGKSYSQIIDKSCAAHNLPFGTKIYIPDLKGKINSTGIFTVEDTGGFCFDFDMFTSSKKNVTGFHTAYIISYGSGKTAASYTYAKKVCDQKYGANAFTSAWKQYMTHGGCLIHFSKFNSEDANASWWKS